MRKISGRFLLISGQFQDICDISGISGEEPWSLRLWQEFHVMN